MREVRGVPFVAQKLDHVARERDAPIHRFGEDEAYGRSVFVEAVEEDVEAAGSRRGAAPSGCSARYDGGSPSSRTRVKLRTTVPPSVFRATTFPASSRVTRYLPVGSIALSVTLPSSNAESAAPRGTSHTE